MSHEEKDWYNCVFIRRVRTVISRDTDSLLMSITICKGCIFTHVKTSNRIDHTAYFIQIGTDGIVSYRMQHIA